MSLSMSLNVKNKFLTHTMQCIHCKTNNPLYYNQRIATHSHKPQDIVVVVCYVIGKI